MNDKIDAKTAELLAIIQVSHPHLTEHTTWFGYDRVWFWMTICLNSAPRLTQDPLEKKKLKEVVPYWFKIGCTRKFPMSLMK